MGKEARRGIRGTIAEEVEELVLGRVEEEEDDEEDDPVGVLLVEEEVAAAVSV